MSTATMSADAISAGQSISGRYLTFGIADEQYGFSIGQVREIVTRSTLTPVPKAIPEMLGILNRRGEVIPVLDLRCRLGLGQAVESDEACIVIVITGEHPVGVWVDHVSEVIDLPASAIVPKGDVMRDESGELLLGFGQTEGGLKLLLDVERVVETLAGLEVD